jgi:hypothetical protein
MEKDSVALGWVVFDIEKLCGFLDILKTPSAFSGEFVLHLVLGDAESLGELTDRAINLDNLPFECLEGILVRTVHIFLLSFCLVVSQLQPL